MGIRTLSTSFTFACLALTMRFSSTRFPSAAASQMFLVDTNSVGGGTGSWWILSLTRRPRSAADGTGGGVSVLCSARVTCARCMSSYNDEARRCEEGRRRGGREEGAR